MAKLVTNGSFYVVAAAEMGARPEMVYWDECPANFQFCSGKDGEEVYHIVYNTRDTTSSKYSKTPYLCVVSHKKNSTYPSDDVKNNGANAKWSAFSNMALIATDIMLARKILAGEIDVDSLTVRNVYAVSSDGNTTCSINGDTGKLTAKNAEFEGSITAVSGSIGGLRINSDSIGYDRTNAGDAVIWNNNPMVSLSRSKLQYNEDYYTYVGTALSITKFITEIGPGYVRAVSKGSSVIDNACLFQCGSYGLKVTYDGVYITQDSGLTWINLFNKIT